MVGNCAIYRGEKRLYGGMNLLRLRPINAVVPFYLLWWLKTDKFVHAIRMLAKHAINQVSVPISALKDIPLPWPPLPEQHTIVAHLDREMARIDTLIWKVCESIDLLRSLYLALATNRCVLPDDDLHRRESPYDDQCVLQPQPRSLTATYAELPLAKDHLMTTSTPFLLDFPNHLHYYSS